MEHKDEGHRIIEAAVYESRHLKSIEDLKSKADKKRSCFQKYVDFIDEQKDRVSNVQKQCTDDINEAYEDLVRQVTEKKEILIGEVKGRTEEVEKELEELKKSAQKHITHLTNIADVVINTTKVPSDMDALAAHDTLCQDLQEALKQEDPDYKQPRQSSRKGKRVSFMISVGLDEIDIGKIVNAVANNIAFPTKDSMNAMVGTPDGRMAVGCGSGGVEIFSADGQLQQTVLKHVQIRVSYSEAKKIQVFSPAGGKVIREIPCDGYAITSYNNYMITASDNTLRLIDKQGVVKYELVKLGSHLCPAVSQGNTIMIAALKLDVGLVSIVEYTNELKHIQNLVNDYKIEKPVRTGTISSSTDQERSLSALLIDSIYSTGNNG